MNNPYFCWIFFLTDLRHKRLTEKTSMDFSKLNLYLDYKLTSKFNVA